MLLLGVSVLWADTHADQLIREVEARYNSAHTLQVQFSEEFTAGGRKRPPESGTLMLQKAGKMRWEYAQPAGKLFILDGKEIYLYTASDNRVEKMPLKSTEDMRAPLAFLLGRLDLKKEFRNFRVRSAPDGEWLDADAKNERVPYESISLRLEGDGTIRKVRIGGRDGSVMTFEFDHEILNPRLDAKLFRFVPPPGAEIVDSVNFAAEGK